MKISFSDLTKHFKYTVIYWVMIFLCFLAQGCLELKQELTLNQDGSGKLKAQYILGKKFTKMIEELETVEKAGGKTYTKGPGFVINEKNLKEKFQGEGIIIEDFLFKTKEGRRYISYTVAFNDIENLLKTKAFRGEEISFYKDKNNNLVFQAGSKHSRKNIIAPGIMPKDLMEGFKADITLNLPGKVLESNADSIEGSSLTWHYTSDKLIPAVMTAACEGTGLPFLAKLPAGPKKITAPNYVYDPTGKPDPFRPFILEVKRPKEGVEKPLQPLQRYEISQLKLVGIIWQTENPRAMFEDAAGKGYIVSKGSYVGKNEGKVSEILENEVIITEKSTDIFGETKIKAIRVKLHGKEGKSK